MFRPFFFALARSRKPLVYLAKAKFMAVVLHVTNKLPIACYKLGELNLLTYCVILACVVHSIYKQPIHQTYITAISNLSNAQQRTIYFAKVISFHMCSLCV